MLDLEAVLLGWSWQPSCVLAKAVASDMAVHAKTEPGGEPRRIGLSQAQ